MAASILVLGAGRSSSSLISCLLDHSSEWGISVTVGDVLESAAAERTTGRGQSIRFDIQDRQASRWAIRASDVVISMIPAHLHPRVAELCLEEGKHLITASYVSDEMRLLDRPAREKNLLFLNECGLDPGIDHMSAMKIIDQVKAQGGKMLSFESFTGGLIAPETDPENPWGYKFTWNPRNVVMAGQGTAKFLQKGHFKYIPYGRLFRSITPVMVSGHGRFEGYVNRDSLKYIDTYGLQGIQTMVRGTLRNHGFCAAWDVLVQLGCTDDSYSMEGVNALTHRDFVNSFLDLDPHKNTEENLCQQMSLDLHGDEMVKLRWSGFFEKELVGLEKGTPAQILEHILNKKWKLSPADKDLVVMWHRFVFESNGRQQEIQSSLVVTGEDSTRTAMARTVGLPMALATKLLVENKISARGVVIPVTKEFYDPILSGLKLMSVEMKEEFVGGS